MANSLDDLISPFEINRDHKQTNHKIINHNQFAVGFLFSSSYRKYLYKQNTSILL